MKIGIAQFDIAWENKSENMKRCQAFFKEARDASCDLLVFPELSLIGFTMKTELAEPCLIGETALFFKKCCEEYGLACVYGYAEAKENDFFNKLAFVREDGAISDEYAKIHAFAYGGESFSAGSECACFSCDGVDIGLSICYDLRFPELYQRLSAKCSCIIVSASWPESRREHWITLLKARAIENQCYMVGCNRTGTGNGIAYCGDSMIVAPDGEVIAIGAYRKEQLICAEIEPNKAELLRRSFPLKADRRTDIYRNFYE